jgi:hypothetical protein
MTRAEDVYKDGNMYVVHYRDEKGKLKTLYVPEENISR